MSPEKERQLLAFLVRLHFGHLVAVPLLGMLSWWFLRRGALPAMIFSGFAAIAAYYAMLAHGYHLTAHLRSALWVIFASPLLLVVSSSLGGGFWYFYLDAAFVEIGGFSAGLMIGVTTQLKFKDYFSVSVIFLFMGGFLAFWGWGVFQTHKGFRWYENIWLVAAVLNEAYVYGRMFVRGQTELNYGEGRAARKAGAGALPGPLKDDGTGLVTAFGVLIVLSPFVIGLLSYLLK